MAFTLADFEKIDLEFGVFGLLNNFFKKFITKFTRIKTFARDLFEFVFKPLILVLSVRVSL